jgi:hypothetical protein
MVRPRRSAGRSDHGRRRDVVGEADMLVVIDVVDADSPLRLERATWNDQSILIVRRKVCARPGLFRKKCW